ncbi:MAG TPA: TonB-dependent receptor [Terriglobales bacterium]|nr:TonB-dependent receptor [Terriglobales bacterium]
MHPSATFRALRCVVIISLLAWFSIAALAQGTGGRILGRVADPTGAVLSGVNVKLINEQTGTSQTAQTGQSGDYQFPQVAVGNYRMEFDQSGFKKAVKKSIVLEINQVLTMNMIMQVGGAQETVEVTSEAPLVDTTSTQLGAVVNDRSVSQLPLNSRDTYQFLQLQPGVQSTVGSDLFYGSDRAGVVSVNGGRGRSNNFSVNGGDANDQFVNLPAIQPSPDSIQEFRVITNTFDAEYGRNSGAIVNVVTKSGTNRLHGSAYEFFRNKVLNARGFFDTQKPDFKQNQFGGTLGGPIKKDQTFFFGSYEGRRLVKGIPSDSVTVPTAAERAGDFSGSPFSGAITDQHVADVFNLRPGCTAAAAAPIVPGANYADIFANSVIPLPCMDPTAVDLMNQFVPLANTPDGFFQAAPDQRDRTDQFTMRVDHRLNDKQNLNAYYYFTDTHLLSPFARFQAGGANLPGFGAITNERYQQWNLTHNWTLSNSTVNEFRFTYFRQAQGDFLHPQRTASVHNSCATVPASQCFSDPTNPKLGITPNLGTNHEGVPFISISGGFGIGNNFEGEIPQIGNTFQWTDNVTKVKGSHTMKFGGDLRRMRFDQTLFFDVNGQYNYFGGGVNDPIATDAAGNQNLFPNYLLGLPDFYLQGSAQTENVRSTIVALFAQDSWKVKPNITLNYGLRWELQTPLTDIGHRVQTFRPGQQTAVYPCQLSPATAATLGNCSSVFPTGLVVPGDKGVQNGLTQTYYKAFAPRIGIAWSPGSSGKTSIRAGWGLFYNPMEQLVLEQFSAEPPFGGSTGISNVMFNTPFVLQDSTVVPNPFNGVLNPPPGKAIDWSVFRPILLFGEFQPKMRTQYSSQYNLNIQRELTKDLVLQVGYVGSQGHRLLATHDINFANPQTCLDLHAISGVTGDTSLDCGQFFSESSYFIPANTIPQGMTLHLPYGSVPAVTGPNPTDITLVGLRPFSSPQCQPTTGVGCPADSVPVFSSIFAQDTIANSNYNSLQASLDKRFAGGLQFQAAYTWSKSIDQASSFEGILNPVDPRRSRGLSQFDARHRFVLSYYWEPPLPKYQGAAGKLINGWALSGITSFQSGFPIRILSSADNELMNSFDFELPGEPDQLKPFRTQDPRTHGGYWFDPTTFTEDTTLDPSLFGRIGNAPRTICCGPGINNWDIALHKNTGITENTHIEFRAEFFNALNHTQFLNPSGNSSNGVDFGRVTRARDPRLLQFALKYVF